LIDARLIGNFIDRLLETMVHPALRVESDIFYRTRVLVGLLLTINALLLAVTIATIVGDMSAEARAIGIPLCVGLMLGNFLLLYVVRASGRYLLCSTAAIALSTLVIVLGIVLSGGIRQSPAAQLLVVPPLMAFFFSGMRLGIWSVVSMLLLVAIFFLLEQAGVAFPFDATVDDVAQSRIQTSLLCIAAVSALALIFERTASKLKSERDREHQKALVLAETDVLTGLSNRRSFDALLDARIGKRPPVRDFALCYVDLDGFKPINDRYGHGAGDEVLRVVAARLKQVVRSNDIVGRHGGDEFTLIIDAVTGIRGVQQTMERMLSSIALPIDTSMGRVSVAASIGVACYPQHGESSVALKKAADQAMYAAKQARNQWRLYSAGANPAAPAQR
jgi:diguanylate cyclase (GGDEF)-like protein